MMNILFWFQIVMAFLYSIPLILNIANDRIEGLTLAMFVIFLVFMTLSFSLALSSYREKPSKIRQRTLIIFANWLVLIAIIVCIGAFKISWKYSDTIFTSVIALLAIGTIIRYKGIQNPMARSWISI